MISHHLQIVHFIQGAADTLKIVLLIDRGRDKPLHIEYVRQYEFFMNQIFQAMKHLKHRIMDNVNVRKNENIST